MPKQPYLCVTIDRTDAGWKSDVMGPDNEVLVGEWPEEIVQQLAELGFELVSASYSERLENAFSFSQRHVVWMRSSYPLDLKSQRVTHV